MNARMRRYGLGIGAALVAVSIAAGVTAATQNTSGQQPAFRGRQGGPAGVGRMGPMGPMGLIGPMIARLGLSDAQKDQVKGIRQAHADEFKALATRARTAHQSLEQAIMTDPINDAAIRQSSADVAAVDADMAVAGAHLRGELFQILTADQQTQAKQMLARRERH